MSECDWCGESEGCQDSKFLKILDVILKCGTEYSGFKSVDLQKWGLKLAAGKYKIKGEVSLDLQTGMHACSRAYTICLKYPKCFRIPLHLHARNTFLSMILPINKYSDKQVIAKMCLGMGM